MTIERVETLVVGGGQAGVAMSEHLGLGGVSHLVLERGQIAESWRSARWDSLVANGPAWHDCFPNMAFPDIGPDDFPGKESVADYFVAYARQINAPIRCGVEVQNVERLPGRPGFRIETSAGLLEARNVVAATGPFQVPVIPSIVPEHARVQQIHSQSYRNPQQLPEGAILVVGAGSSGSQIADELLRSGRRVYLSVGPHDRPPRRYRGRDFVWWLGVLGKWDVVSVKPGTEHVTIAVSGADGGSTVDFRRLAARGMTLLGMTESYDNGILHIAPDLADNISKGDANYLSVLDEADQYVRENGLQLPLDPEARKTEPDTDCMTHPLRSIDLNQAGISTIIWATGYKTDYSWLNVDVFDELGKPQHQRGVSSQAGIYFLGLPWQSRRGSSFIWGVWHDARYLADHMLKQRRYHDYPG